MSDIHVVTGFKLPCRECGRVFLLGHTKEFAELYTKKTLTMYWAADAKPGDKGVGVSEGSGDTFECKRCHAIKWMDKVRALGVEP